MSAGNLGEGGLNFFGGAEIATETVVKQFNSADCKRGRRKGATSRKLKNRQKVSKSFSTLFDNFRAGKKSQKSSKSVKKFFDTFRQFSRGTFFRPLLQSR